MRHIFLFILLVFMCACEEQGDASKQSKSIGVCQDFGQRDKSWIHDSEEMTFNGDCSAFIAGVCQTSFVYGEIEDYDQDTDRLKGNVMINILSSNEGAQGCFKTGTQECHMNVSFNDGEPSTINLKCADQAIIFITED